MVKGWAEMAGLDARRFSGHSMRRTKVTVVYNKTKDVRACAQLLGHANLGHTIAYLATDTTAALELALSVQF
jgi:integrase